MSEQSLLYRVCLIVVLREALHIWFVVYARPHIVSWRTAIRELTSEKVGEQKIMGIQGFVGHVCDISEAIDEDGVVWACVDCPDRRLS